jgi:class 3 adenylate cyclase
VREPTQIFTLLESIYGAFDKLAKKSGIFKIEAIGDSYVAVAGLPEKRDDHAVVMAEFAFEAALKMREVVRHLEIFLGPDTSDLCMRFGLNSGPVTAGVLRGEKSRFQLIGDTINTAARMEKTSARNRIQLTGETARLLQEADKSHWIRPRDEVIYVKGKGEIKTYWLDCIGEKTAIKDRTETTSASRLDSTNVDLIAEAQLSLDNKTERLVGWSVDLHLGLLKRIVAMRASDEEYSELRAFKDIVEDLDEKAGLANKSRHNIDGIKPPRRREPRLIQQRGQTVLDEVKEIIVLPRKAARYQQDPELVQLPAKAIAQLHKYVKTIAGMYRNNPFHNYEHASHVTQSVTKLLSRVVMPDEIDYDGMCYKKKAATSKLHKYTYGITSDPITQFACAFSSLIHDLDHPGVPNTQLIKEGSEMAALYRNQSVAEQNSVDLAWGLLMEPTYKDLRECIYTSQSELDRFRQLIVNSVMATDIVDKDLKALRNGRWDKAFKDAKEDDNPTDDVNRKATIVIEHLIQAADVAHTMQHWHVYLKWNERLFHELYKAYLAGRAETDPSEGWYKGEIGFFDFYIIPLAKKLENCGVFGVSSDECLNYAQANRAEWERKGKDIVERYLKVYKEQKPEPEHA